MMGPSSNKNKLSLLFSKVGKQVGLLLLALLVTFGVYYLYHHHQQQKYAFRQQEDRTAAADNQNLANHDYKDYQTRMADYADGYISLGKYDEAERVLNNVTDKVPADKIISDTYRSYWLLYQRTGNTTLRKKYALLAAEKLKQEGQAQTAAAFEADANGK